MTTNEAALKLAREIARVVQPPSGSEVAERAARAAILEVTERAANQAAIWDKVVAMSLRDMEHLS